MQQESQVVELKEEITSFQGVCFDPDEVCLEGYYSDEITAYRSKKNWVKILESNFLLDLKQDFKLKVQQQEKMFVLKCEFLSACGRYAFWRLTNNQAPEAQYQIETSHIPDCETKMDDFIAAPDLQPADQKSWILNPPQRISKPTHISKIIDRIMAKIKIP